MKYYNSYSTELLEKGYVHIKSFYKVDQIKQINQKIIQVINSVSSFYLGNSCADINLEGGAINKILQHMQYNRRDLISIIYDAVKTITFRVSKGWPSGLFTGKKLSQIHSELV